MTGLLVIEGRSRLALLLLLLLVRKNPLDGEASTMSDANSSFFDRGDHLSTNMKKKRQFSVARNV